MMPLDDEPQESDVPALALLALKAASEATQAAGHPRIVVLQNRQLVRIDGETITVLKQLPPRPQIGPTLNPPSP
jgi:hypothetical protein